MTVAGLDLGEALHIDRREAITLLHHVEEARADRNTLVGVAHQAAQQRLVQGDREVSQSTQVRRQPARPALALTALTTWRPPNLRGDSVVELAISDDPGVGRAYWAST